MGHELTLTEELAYHHEKYGWYCKYCGAGEFDSVKALEKHEAKCKRNPKNNRIILLDGEVVVEVDRLDRFLATQCNDCPISITCEIPKNRWTEVGDIIYHSAPLKDWKSVCKNKQLRYLTGIDSIPEKLPESIYEPIVKEM